MRFLGVFEEVEVEYFCFVEVPAVFGSVDEVARYDYLVEKVPRAFVCQSTDATVQNVPPGLVESVFGNAGVGCAWHRE